LPYILKKNIKFEKVSFKYKTSNNNIISDLNLDIKKGERLGLIGKTGSGKSTLVDLIMGLLNPQKGSIFIDGIKINNNENSSLLFSWRASIAHVPQNIFLINATIAENIAFGVPFSKIDLNRVKNAAKQACIDDFIKDTKNGYFTKTGERGIMLSGGQLQRIGIARAIYKKAKILILDEATSALDIETEEKIIKNIEVFSSDVTIIFIAHRYSLLRNCNRIIEINNGKIIKDKSYKDFFYK
jgi:ATP-binding cassette subfamily B protein